MRRVVSAVFALLLVPSIAWAHAGHGLVDGHEWFHALLPFAGAMLLILARPVCKHALARLSRAVRQ